MHSAFSLLEGALPIARLAELAKADRQPALALTDTGNLFGALEFSEKMAEAGVQPIIGCALAVLFDDEPQVVQTGRVPRLPRIVLLAASEEGYRNLIALVSRSFLEVAGRRHAARQARMARGACRRPDRAHRRSRRARSTGLS